MGFISVCDSEEPNGKIIVRIEIYIEERRGKNVEQFTKKARLKIIVD